MKNNFKKFIELLFSRGYGTLAQFGLILLIARYFSEEDVGLFLLFLSWVSFLAVFFGLGFPVYVLKTSSRTSGKSEVTASRFLRTILRKILIFSVLIFSVAILLMLGWHWGEVSKQEIVLMYSIVAGCILAIYKILIEFIKGRVSALKAISLEFNVIPTLMIIAALYYIIFSPVAPEIFTLLIVYLFASLFILLLVGVYFLRKFSAFRIFGDVHVETRRLISLWGASILVVLMAVVPYIVFPFFDISAKDIALFGVVHKIVALSATIQYLVNSFYAPHFSRLHYEEKFETLFNKYRESIFLSVTLFLPFFGVAYFFDTEILSLFGEVYVEGKLLLLILIVSRLVNALMGTSDIFLHMIGETSFELLSSLVAIFIFMGSALLYMLIKTGISPVLYITYAYAAAYAIKSVISFVFLVRCDFGRNTYSR